ncbi:unnamed protein product [Linum tenue]|uniref:Uncharacterized protein n=1 Tax=Linum tenue TaxID=586396 RepID=A0AAV0K7F9_9ROSI|nr:unnamed protein product [Linum tenue]
MERMADSEVSHSSDSFSLPSEPPDLRNWFSSYQYDSFVLDTCDDAFKSRGQKDPSIVDVADKIRANEDENLSERLETGECGEGSENLTTQKTGFLAMYLTLVGWIMMENLRRLLFGKVKATKVPLSRKASTENHILRIRRRKARWRLKSHLPQMR